MDDSNEREERDDRVRVVVDLDKDDCALLDKLVRHEKLRRSDVLRRLIRQEAEFIDAAAKAPRRRAANG